LKDYLIQINNMSKKFDFNDITLVPEVLSTISSRKEIKIFDEKGKLPLMVSPMDTVIDSNNTSKFFECGFEICFPRGVNSFYNGFKAISLDEFEDLIDGRIVINSKILVDIANGHMERLYDLCERFLQIRPFSELMIGNIANPKTFEKFASLGVRYIRVGIGGGSACLTSANTGVHYPMASLIEECYNIVNLNKFETKIVADGGFRNYDDIIKALALGADYVMLGGILNKTLESCSDTYIFGKIKVSPNFAKMIWDSIPYMRKFMYKKFRGMSTKQVQKKWGRKEIKTSEGIHKLNKVEYTIEGWTENFKDYLKSAMSYTDSRNLKVFKGSEYVFITENAHKRFNK